MSVKGPGIVCIVGMAAVLAGCINPMIPIPAVTASITQDHLGTPIADLDKSVAEADGLRNAYMDAAANISTTRELSAATILGLGAAALGIVVTHGGGQFPIAAGIGGATLLGLSTRTLTTTQQNIYFAGAQALTCALQSQVPILALANDYKTLREDVLHLDQAISTFAALRPAGEDASLLNAAIATDVKARDLLGHMETAGFLLDQQTNAIKIAVDKQTAQSEPDLQSITGVVSGLGTTVSGLGAPGLPSSGPKSPAGPHAGQFAVNNLQQARANLNAAVAAVQPLLSRADAVAQVSGTLATCVPSAAQAAEAANKAANAANKAADAAQTAQKAATDAQAAAAKAATTRPPPANAQLPKPQPPMPDAQMQAQDKSNATLLSIADLRTKIGFAATDAAATITGGSDDRGVMRMRLAALHSCLVANKSLADAELQRANPHGWLYNNFFAVITHQPPDPSKPDPESIALKACVAQAAAMVPSPS